MTYFASGGRKNLNQFWAVSPPHSSAHSSIQILLPRYFMSNLISVRETYREYSVAHTVDLIRFQRSKVKVTGGHRGGEGIHIDAGV